MKCDSCQDVCSAQGWSPACFDSIFRVLRSVRCSSSQQFSWSTHGVLSPAEAEPTRPGLGLGLGLASSIGIGLAAIPEEALWLIFAVLPAGLLGRLASSSQAFGPLLRRFLQVQNHGWPLYVLHTLQASEVAFPHCADGNVSGEDGWLSELGDCFAQSADIAGGRYCWQLELLRHDGLLAVGIADRWMPENAFLGSESNQWFAWGWELRPGAAPEAVGNYRNVRDVRPHPVPEMLAGQQMDINLRPSPERRVVLCLHMDCARGVLELHVRTSARPGWPWRWRLIGSIVLEEPLEEALRRAPKDSATEESGELQERRSHKDSETLNSLDTTLRPVISVDIGAAVRLLRS